MSPIFQRDKTALHSIAPDFRGYLRKVLDQMFQYRRGRACEFGQIETGLRNEYVLFGIFLVFHLTIGLTALRLLPATSLYSNNRQVERSVEERSAF